MLFKRTIRIYVITASLLLLLLVSPWGAYASFTPSNGQAATLVLGQPNFTSGHNATTQAGMYYPSGVTVDPVTGKVFVADTSNNRVLRFASVNALANGAAAEAVLGQADFTSGSYNRGGAVAANTMWGPGGLSADSSGRLWVSDGLNDRVLRFDNASTKANGANADGVLGQPDFTSYVYGTTQSVMGIPKGVFIDSSGRLWVADSYNNRVLRFDNAAAKANGANADGVLGQTNFNNSSGATTQNGMYTPSGVFADSSGRLWVAEYDNNRVLRFDNASSKANGANADGVLGQTSFTSNGTACTQGGMYSAEAVSGDDSGRLYVSDHLNRRVLVFEGAAGLANGANASYVLGQTNFTTCSLGAVGASKLTYPCAVFYDAAARVLWVADHNSHRVLMYGTPDQVVSLPPSLVLGQADFSSYNPATSQTGMTSAYGVTVDPTTGKVFVSDFKNHRILRFASATGLTNGAAAEGVLGQANFTSGVCNRGAAVAQNGMCWVRGLSVDSSGRLWAADSFNNRVLRFDNASSKANGDPADGVLGQPGFTTQGSATTQNGMSYPIGVFADSSGRLWVADYRNSRVLRFDNAAAKANGDPADGVLGQTSFASNLIATTQNGMQNPYGVFTESSGRLWVADSLNNRVLRFDNAAAKPNGGNADGVLGQPNFTSSGAACTRSGMNLPAGISGDSSGLLFVTDYSYNRVMVFLDAASLPNGDIANSVMGQTSFTACSTNPGGISAYTFSQPTHSFYDGAARVLWVADGSNNRVLRRGYPVRLFMPMLMK